MDKKRRSGGKRDAIWTSHGGAGEQAALGVRVGHRVLRTGRVLTSSVPARRGGVAGTSASMCPALQPAASTAVPSPAVPHLCVGACQQQGGAIVLVELSHKVVCREGAGAQSVMIRCFPEALPSSTQQHGVQETAAGDSGAACRKTRLGGSRTSSARQQHSGRAPHPQPAAGQGLPKARVAGPRDGTHRRATGPRRRGWACRRGRAPQSGGGGRRGPAPPAPSPGAHECTP